MTFQFQNLDQRTRDYMLEEIQLDEGSRTLYKSNYLSPRGNADWTDLLKEAARTGTEITLASELRRNQRLLQQVQRRKPKGGFTTAAVPHTAAETMAEGEFNRFYIRALCRRSIDDGLGQVIAYRARPSAISRPESEAIMGRGFDPAVLLADLRSSPGVDAALDLAKPNSGLTVRLP